jgi:hypothetical protein
MQIVPTGSTQTVLPKSSEAQLIWAGFPLTSAWQQSALVAQVEPEGLAGKVLKTPTHGPQAPLLRQMSVPVQQVPFVPHGSRPSGQRQVPFWHVVDPVQAPHAPPHPSSPQVLPVQSGIQVGADRRLCFLCFFLRLASASCRPERPTSVSPQGHQTPRGARARRSVRAGVPRSGQHPWRAPRSDDGAVNRVLVVTLHPRASNGNRARSPRVSA